MTVLQQFKANVKVGAKVTLTACELPWGRPHKMVGVPRTVTLVQSRDFGMAPEGGETGYMSFPKASEIALDESGQFVVTPDDGGRFVYRFDARQ